MSAVAVAVAVSTAKTLGGKDEDGEVSINVIIVIGDEEVTDCSSVSVVDSLILLG